MTGLSWYEIFVSNLMEINGIYCGVIFVILDIGV